MTTTITRIDVKRVLVTSNGKTIVRKVEKHNRAIPYATKWMTNKINVARSYEIVAESMGSRVVHAENRARVITDALIVHRRNRQMYNRVMG